MLILNGQEYEPGAPEVTLLNRSFQYGDGLFESLRVWRGNILFLPDHLDRLVKGMKVLKMEFEETQWRKLIQKELQRALEVNQLQQHGRLRLHVYRAGTGAYASLDDRPMYLIEAYSLKENYFEYPVTASLTTFREVPLIFSPLSGMKLANSLPYILAANHARRSGYDDAIMFCEREVSQSSTYNLFVVKERQLFTPPLKSGCVDGVMRRQIFRISEELKIPCQEKRLKLSGLKQATELFLTNSTRGIVAVNQLEDIYFDTAAFSIVPFLQNSFRRYVMRKYG